MRPRSVELRRQFLLADETIPLIYGTYSRTIQEADAVIAAKTRVWSLLTVAILVVVAGCGGGSSSKPVIGVSISPSATQAIDQGQQVHITAMVSNDSAAAGVTWSLTGQGTLTSPSATAVTYSAPTTGAAGSATVTATAVTDPTKSVPLTINVSLLPSFTTTTLPAGVEGTAYNRTLGVTGGSGTLSYSIASRTLPTGLSLNGTTGAITGTPTGPDGLSNFTVKVTDSSSAGPQSATQALSVAINLPPAPTITTTSLPSASEFTAYSQTIQATGYAPLSFSVTSGTLPVGLNLNSTTGAITGPPQGPPGTSNFTITVTDSSNSTQTASQALSITVNGATCGTGSESLLNGQYAFSLQGFDASGPAAMVGSFTANGTGGITGGTEDINSNGPSGVQSDLNVTTASSSYSIGSDHQVCLTLTAGGVTRSFRFVASLIGSGVASGARIIEFDSTGAGTTGTIRVQYPGAFSNAQVSGNYAFGASAGKTAANGGGRFGAVGVLTLSGTSVTGSGDINDDGTINRGSASYPASPIPFTGGAYNIAANGRGTLSFIPNGGSAVNTVIYILSSNEFFLMSSDAQNVNPLLSGLALQQSNTPYVNSSLSAVSLIYVNGLTGTGTGSRADVGLFTPDGAGNFTFSGDENSGGTISTLSFSGTYSVAGSGRVLITKTGSTTPDILEYLVSPNMGFILFTDKQVMAKSSEPVTGGPFTNASLNGKFSFATIDPPIAEDSTSAGYATFDGSGNVNGTSDDNAAGLLSLGNAFSQTYAVSASGRTVLPATGTPQTLIYIISPAKVVIFDIRPSTTNPTIQVAEQ
jgi:hypothetical protein